MNEKFCAPTTVTNGEIKENGDVKSGAPGEDCGVEDSLKLCVGSGDEVKSRDCLSNLKSNAHSNVGGCPASKKCANNDNLSSNIISEQVDTCEPDAKGSDSLVEDSADTLTENEGEDDFKLALSPEASGPESSSEQNQEDITEQTMKPSESSNNIEVTEIEEQNEDPAISKDTEDDKLGNTTSDNDSQSIVNVGSDINNCAITVDENFGGETKMVVENDSKNDVHVDEVTNKQGGSEVVPSLPIEATAVLNESSEMKDGCESEELPTTSAARDEIQEAEQSTNTEGCKESSDHVSCTSEKSTNPEIDPEPVVNDHENKMEISSSNKEDTTNEFCEAGKSSDKEVKAGGTEKIETDLISENNVEKVGKVEDEISQESKNIGKDELTTLDEDALLNSPKRRKTSPSSECNDDSDDKIEKAGEEPLKVSLGSKIDGITDEKRKSEEVEDESILKSSGRELSDDQAIDAEKEDALLRSPVQKGSEVIDEDMEELEDDALLNSPEPEVQKDKAELDNKMEEDLLKSPEKQSSVKIVEDEKTGLSAEKLKDDKTGSNEESLKENEKIDSSEDKPKEDEKTSLNEENLKEEKKFGSNEDKLKEDEKTGLNEEEIISLNEEKGKDEEMIGLSEDKVDDVEMISLNEEKVKDKEMISLKEEKVKDEEKIGLNEEKVKNEEKNDLSEENVEEESTPKSSSGSPVKVGAVSEKIEENVKTDPSSEIDASAKSKEDDKGQVNDEIEVSKSPVCPKTVSDACENLEASKEKDSTTAVQVVESMELDLGDSMDSTPAREDVSCTINVKKPPLTLELNGTAKDGSDLKATIFCSNSSKDEDAAMPVSRKRAYSPVVDDIDQSSQPADTKLARLINGHDEDSNESVDKTKDVKKLASLDTADKKSDVSSVDKLDICADSMDTSDYGDSKVSSENEISEITTKRETDVKDKVVESEPSLLDLSYLRKLHKGQVEKMSRNDLEELVVQKLCEAITERSQVGEMRLRCQALERGQEKWKDKYSQLQKQVRELNIVLKKFLSEQATAVREKTIPPTPVRITRSVGLQVALPGTGQRSLAALRLRQQREAAAAAANASTSTSPASRSSPASGSNATNVNTAQNTGPTRCVAVAQSPVRRPPEPKPAPPPPQRQVNSVVTTNTVLTTNATSPRIVSAPQPSLTLTRPQMATQVQAPIQTTQANNGRPRGNLNVGVRPQTQPHVIHQVQSRQSPIQPQHTSVSQVVVSSNSTPPIGRFQVVLAPQQQQQIQQQQIQQQQIVIRQPQSASKDVEVIDLDKEDRSRQPTRVQQIQSVNTTPPFSANGNMTVRLVPNNQQSGVQQSHMTLLVPATSQQQKMIITSTPSTVQLNSNQGKSRTNVVLKGVVQAMNAQANSALRQQSVVQQGTLINSRGLTILQQPQQAQQQIPQLQQLRPIRVPATHPAPLPSAPAAQPDNPSWKMPPPKPSLKIQHTDNGIVLSWNMNLYSTYEDIDTYQLYAYQEGTSPPSSTLWKKVGDVKALPLPMACTLTQFAEGHRYHFAVRAVDIRSRVGPFSAPGNIRLEQKTQ